MADEDYYYSDDDEYVYEDTSTVTSPARQGSAPSSTSSAASGAHAHAQPRAYSSAAAAAHAPASGFAASSSSASEYRLLAPEEIESEQQRVIASVASVLAIPFECARTLLIHFKWNREKLVDQYTTDPVTVRRDAGIAHLGESSVSPGGFTCPICMDDARDGFALGCKHYFCRTCWAGFLEAAVKDAGQACIFSRCPELGCGEAVTLSVVSAMAAPDVAHTWRRFETQQFVNISKNMAWCPQPGCNHAFIARSPVKTVMCSCGMKFCFKCSREPHEPVICEQNDKWMLKCGNESETANWILANTKRCPACGTRIEKNQGCNHMVCKSKGCKFEFCWVCLGPWSDHGQSTGGYYKCNKYKEAVTRTDTSDAAKAKAELDKYLFYYQRFSNHDQAGKFAARHRAAAQRCRRVLKYTYVYGYYMEQSPEKQLFEHLQEQLERSTEHLAELTEKPVDKMDRAEVVNFTRVTMQFLRNLLTGIEDGLTTGL